MDKSEVLSIISDFKKSLEKQKISINKIILYGSWSKGTQKDESDIDLVVVSHDFENKSYWERIDLLTEAIHDVFAPIEAIAVTPKEWEEEKSFICQFAKDSEIIT